MQELSVRTIENLGAQTTLMRGKQYGISGEIVWQKPAICSSLGRLQGEPCRKHNQCDPQRIRAQQVGNLQP